MMISEISGNHKPHQIKNVSSSPETASLDRVNSCQQGFVLLGAACGRGGIAAGPVVPREDVTTFSHATLYYLLTLYYVWHYIFATSFWLPCTFYYATTSYRTTLICLIKEILILKSLFAV
jgi:hypothetical protein